MPYLNGLPLVELWEQPALASQVELTVAVPSRLAMLLEAGALDVALLSSIEAFRRREVVVVDGICIAADGPVRSVRVLSRVPLSEIRTLVADEGSLTSVALAKVVLEALWGVKPTTRTAAPDVSAMLAEGDAALVIGDVALRPYHAAHVLDLGQAWKELTGLPFVYAMWIAKDATTAEAAQPLLIEARDWGMQHLKEIGRKWASRNHVARHIAEDYLIHVIDYQLDARKKESLAVFAKLCVQHGVLSSAYPVRYRP